MVNSSIVNSTSEKISRQTRKRVGGNQIGYLRDLHRRRGSLCQFSEKGWREWNESQRSA